METENHRRRSLERAESLAEGAGGASRAGVLGEILREVRRRHDPERAAHALYELNIAVRAAGPRALGRGLPEALEIARRVSRDPERTPGERAEALRLLAEIQLEHPVPAAPVAESADDAYLLATRLFGDVPEVVARAAAELLLRWDMGFLLEGTAFLEDRRLRASAAPDPRSLHPACRAWYGNLVDTGLDTVERASSGLLLLLVRRTWIESGLTLAPRVEALVEELPRDEAGLRRLWSRILLRRDRASKAIEGLRGLAVPAGTTPLGDREPRRGRRSRASIAEPVLPAEARLDHTAPLSDQAFAFPMAG